TCLSALRASRSFGELADNDSKGCGGVMRVAPCAFFPDAFTNAAESAHTTHGHPSGYLAAGLFADILARIWREELTLAAATRASLSCYGDLPGMEETRRIIEHVLALHAAGERPNPDSIECL